uniref:Alternative protein PLEKHA5 n=1 Tax=Homo sapiens TaxID=9606 RepID=L8E8X2_HUMAN|nr:alternative protein PLEKHA5 [Homo sapiens]
MLAWQILEVEIAPIQGPYTQRPIESYREQIQCSSWNSGLKSRRGGVMKKKPGE